MIFISVFINVAMILSVGATVCTEQSLQQVNNNIQIVYIKSI